MPLFDNYAPARGRHAASPLPIRLGAGVGAEAVEPNAELSPYLISGRLQILLPSACRSVRSWIAQ
jgi:hypothetical protein